MKTTIHCKGCRDDFYNGKNDLGVKRCWSLDTAVLVTKFSISASTPMWFREAYVKVRVPACYHQPGFVLVDEIPNYAKTPSERDELQKRQDFIVDRPTESNP